MNTKITRLLNCRYPILLPGMSWISDATLVRAVSRAGGVGILATGPLSPAETRTAIQEIRHGNNLPFGVGVTLLMPGALENAWVAVQEQVPILHISLGKNAELVQAVHDYGGKVICTVTTIKHAEAALESGADALMITGHEAAAHGADVTSLVLLPTMRQAFDVPIIAAGGFATGPGLLAALSLGADGIAMGSRLAVSLESPLAAATKEEIVKASSFDTIYGKNFDGLPARVLQTPVSTKLMSARPWFPVVLYRAMQASQQMKMPLWKVLAGLVTRYNDIYTIAQFGAATKAIMAATVHGDLTHGVQFIGQNAGLINDIASVDHIIQRTIRDARSRSSQLVNDLSSP
jgi:enoyl-[acyl-carrier protein] reductase II